MKRYILNLFLLVMLFSVSACSDDDLGPSIFDPSTEELTELDLWMQANFTKPYNIEVLYKWLDIESDMAATLVPPTEDNAAGLADVLKKIWCLPYVNIAGNDFFCKLAPKQLMFIGSSRYNSDGTVTKGSAEGGRKIIIYEVNQFDRTNATRLKRYMKTIHHEFGHILNQTKPYTTDFKEITGTLYVGDSCWDTYKTDASALQVGLISRYAGSEDTEDFVELISIYVTRPQEAWDKLLTTAGADGAAIINQKFEIVRNYLQNSWNINIDELRESVLRRADEVPDMDLESLDD